MELKKYKILNVNNVTPHIPISLQANLHEHYGLNYATQKPTATIIYDLPFIYNEFKMICLMTIFRHEGVSFQQIYPPSSTHEFCEIYKGYMIDYKVKIKDGEDGAWASINGELDQIEMTILLTEVEIQENPKFRTVPA